MKLSKRLLRTTPVRAALCWLAASYIRLVRATGRWQVFGLEHVQPLWDRGEPFVSCFWHGRLLLMIPLWTHSRPIHMINSPHPDGQMMARMQAYFGVRSIAASSTRGGTAGTRASVKVLRDGGYVAITPDGPKGPRMRAGVGTVAIARMGRAVLVPCTFSTRRRWVLGTWDRLVVPLPFSRGVYIWGEPVTVPADATPEQVEAARRLLETRLNAITAEADRLCGHAAIEPEAPPSDEQIREAAA